MPGRPGRAQRSSHQIITLRFARTPSSPAPMCGTRTLAHTCSMREMMVERSIRGKRVQFEDETFNALDLPARSA